MLCPPNASRRRDWWQLRGLALHHRDAPYVRSLVVREAAFEIAGLEKVIDISVQHILMRRLPVRPVAEEIADIGAAGPAGRAHQRRSHLHLTAAGGRLL